MPLLADIYIFKVNNKNTRARLEICSQLPIKTQIKDGKLKMENHAALLKNNMVFSRKPKLFSAVPNDRSKRSHPALLLRIK